MNNFNYINGKMVNNKILDSENNVSLRENEEMKM